MLKTFTVVAALTAVALAQNNSSTLIPTGISSTCSEFLTTLNADTQLSTCTSALTKALSAFAPGSNETVSASTVTSALGNICSSTVTSSCPTNLLGNKITQFYTACTAELTSSPNDKVIALYDIIYTVTPLQKAVCSKDDAGKWCVMAATPAEGTSADSLQSALYTESGQTVIPNTNTFSKNNIPFLFLSPDLPESTLCTACTRNVLTSYISFESDIPYAPGLSKSQLLNKQGDLFSAVQSKCGANFMDSEVKAAGGIKSGIGSGLNSGAVPAVSTEFQTLMAAVAGFMTLAVTAAF